MNTLRKLAGILLSAGILISSPGCALPVSPRSGPAPGRIVALTEEERKLLEGMTDPEKAEAAAARKQ